MNTARVIQHLLQFTAHPTPLWLPLAGSFVPVIVDMEATVNPRTLFSATVGAEVLVYLKKTGTALIPTVLAKVILKGH